MARYTSSPRSRKKPMRRKSPRVGGRAPQRPGRPGRPQGTARRAVLQNGASSRMSRRGTTPGTTASTRILANSSNSRVAQARGRSRVPSVARGNGNGTRPSIVPKGFIKMRRDNNSSLRTGMKRFEELWCPQGTTTITDKCIKATSKAQTQFIAKTGNLKPTRGRRRGR